MSPNPLQSGVRARRPRQGRWGGPRRDAMKSYTIIRWGLATALMAGATQGQDRAPQAAPPLPAGPLAWIENRGQFDTPARFVSRLGRQRFLAEPGAIGLDLPAGDGLSGAYVRLVFEGASEAARIEGSECLPGVYSYFIGNDPALWRPGVPSFARVRYDGLYAGIDLVVREEAGRLEYDLHLDPGADLDRVVVRVEGAVGLCLSEDGALEIATDDGLLRQPAGRAFELLPGGGRREVPLRWRLLDDGRFGFDVEGRDPEMHLYVDPGLVWSTYLGAVDLTTGDIAFDVAVDAQGDVVVTGYTEPVGFPITPGAYTYGASLGQRTFVTRFAGATGTLTYSTTIGGFQSISRSYGIAVDAMGRATIVGETPAADFPTTPGAFDTVKDAFNASAFVLRLNPPGTALEFSTFLEATNGAVAWTVGLASDGTAVVGGTAYGAGFPTTPGSFQPTHVGHPDQHDAFVTRFNADGSGLIWSTYLGGTKIEEAFALKVDELDRVTVAGQTYSPEFPVTPGTYSNPICGFPNATEPQAFLSRFSSDGSALVWSTIFGGCKDEVAYDLDLDARGGVVVVGRTTSGDFPVTPGVIQPVHNDPHVGGSSGWADGFVTRFDATASRLIYSTFLGGAGIPDNPRGVAVDPSGVATVCGWSAGSFPTTAGAFQEASTMGTSDAYVTRIDPSGRRLLYSTFVGGQSSEGWVSVQRMKSGRAAAVGNCYLGDYPTTPNAFSPNYVGGQTDGVITVIDLLPTGVRRYGGSTPACLGPIEAGAVPMPKAGATGFRLWCSAAPPLSSGFLLVSTLPAQPTGTSHGVFLWVDPGALVSVVPVFTTRDGYAEIAYPLTGLAPGAKRYVQFVFFNTASCPGSSALCASDALGITVQ